MFDFSIIQENLGLYLSGALLTLELVAGSLALGLILAVPLAVIAYAQIPVLTWGVRGFSFFFRGTPLLVQIFLVYYGVGQLDSIKGTPVWLFFEDAHRCALTAFVLNTAAYTMEIMHGAMLRVPSGEVEAAKSCGMPPIKILSRIVLPSAFRRALPAYGNEVIFMLHGTSLASTITLVELTGAARLVNSRYYSPYEAFVAAGVIYLAMTFLITSGFRCLEKKVYRHL